MGITRQQHKALSELLTPAKAYLLTNVQQQALRVLLQQSTPEADEQETLPSHTCSQPVFGYPHGKSFDCPACNAECDCGHTDDPNHPKRGFCKRKLGGVS